jgi:thiol:disulfide interchange protein DsbD
MRFLTLLLLLLSLLGGLPAAHFASVANVAHAANADDLLEPDKAFRFSARALDPATLEVRFQIADGYYMYREKFRFVAEPDAVKFGTPEFPAGKVKQDEFFGRVETYRKDLVIRMPMTGDAQQFKLLVTSQGCADIGVCYIPQTQSADIMRVAASSGVGGALSSLFPARGNPGLEAKLADAAPDGQSMSESVRPAAGSDFEIAALFQSGNSLLVLASFFGFGLLLAFTPCMLPMIPILSGIIAGEGRDLGKLRALFLSLAYVLGMAVTYAIAGVAAGFSGTMLAAALQNAWILGGFALVFVVLSLSMFGLYELQLPGFLRHRLHAHNHTLQGGRVVSVTLMGVLSAVVMSPCVAAPLAGALLYIGQTRDALMGGAALFVMALGMGVPLVVVGVSEGALLPRAGAWMNAVKQFFGVLLLAVAIWIASPVLPPAAVLFAWAALLVGSGVLLRAIDPLPPQSRLLPRVGKALGVVALLAGAAMLAGALGGSRDPLSPLEAFRAGGVAEGRAVQFERVASVAELESRLAQAGRPVMLDFYADWCVSCKEMERYTFRNAQVGEKLSGMLLLQADVTANTEDHKALLRRFKLFGPPGIVFFDARGKEIAGLRVVGYQNAEKFGKTLDIALR